MLRSQNDYQQTIDFVDAYFIVAHKTRSSSPSDDLLPWVCYHYQVNVGDDILTFALCITGFSGVLFACDEHTFPSMIAKEYLEPYEGIRPKIPFENFFFSKDPFDVIELLRKLRHYHEKETDPRARYLKQSYKTLVKSTMHWPMTLLSLAFFITSYLPIVSLTPYALLLLPLWGWFIEEFIKLYVLAEKEFPDGLLLKKNEVLWSRTLTIISILIIISEAIFLVLFT